MFRGYWGWGHGHWHPHGYWHPYRRWYRGCRPYYGCFPFGCLWMILLPVLLTMWLLLAGCTRLAW